MGATRFFRISAAKMGPNPFHQNRTVSWLMSIPRSHSRSSTLRGDSGCFTYIITARRIISGELLKYRQRLLMTGTYPKLEAAPNDWSDNAKGGSDWRYSWVPVVGPLVGGAVAALLIKTFF